MTLVAFTLGPKAISGSLTAKLRDGRSFTRRGNNDSRWTTRTQHNGNVSTPAQLYKKQRDNIHVSTP